MASSPSPQRTEQLSFRFATADDLPSLKAMVIESFEPITWQKKLDEQFGLLNGCDWRERWNARLEKIFRTQIVLLGELSDQLAAMASAAVDRESALGFIDVLAVAKAFQGHGLGRQMLGGICDHLKSLGCQSANLDCLTDNDAGNALYESEGFTEVARHIRWFRKL